jgi:hypothetical protein
MNNERFTMRASQIIALLLPDSYRDEKPAVEPATALLRDHEGRMSLEPVTADMAGETRFMEQMMTTGCFRRGKPIVDPTTRQIMGYEMEMVVDAEAQLFNTRLQLSAGLS